MQINIQSVDFNDLPGWKKDDHQTAFKLFTRSAKLNLSGHFSKDKHLKIDEKLFENICKSALSLENFGDVNGSIARRFFEEHFQPVKLNNCTNNADDAGFVTGYYEPEIEVSFNPHPDYPFPLYKRPHDLISAKDIDLETYEIPTSFQYVRKTQNGYTIHPDRKQIDQGYLKDKELEIAYVKNRADAYFIHIQGSAKLFDTSGRTLRITYCAKTGHPYTSIGKILVQDGEIASELISMDTIKTWLYKHPEKADALLWRNSSYIFFKEAQNLESDLDPKLDPGLGPVGAAKVQLSPLRSLAVDKNIYPFGLPIYVASKTLTGLDDSQYFKKLMIAQDTGSAIIGPNRGDIFVGSGKEAGQIAGEIRHKADFFTLLPKA